MRRGATLILSKGRKNSGLDFLVEEAPVEERPVDEGPVDEGPVDEGRSFSKVNGVNRDLGGPGEKSMYWLSSSLGL